MADSTSTLAITEPVTEKNVEAGDKGVSGHSGATDYLKSIQTEIGKSKEVDASTKRKYVTRAYLKKHVIKGHAALDGVLKDIHGKPVPEGVGFFNRYKKGSFVCLSIVASEEELSVFPDIKNKGALEMQVAQLLARVGVLEKEKAALAVEVLLLKKEKEVMLVEVSSLKNLVSGLNKEKEKLAEKADRLTEDLRVQSWYAFAKLVASGGVDGGGGK